jgi:hypothetical protein
MVMQDLWFHEGYVKNVKLILTEIVITKFIDILINSTTSKPLFLEFNNLFIPPKPLSRKAFVILRSNTYLYERDGSFKKQLYKIIY